MGNNNALSNSGGNLSFVGHSSFPGFWLDVGNLISYKPPIDETGETEVTFPDLTSFSLDGIRKVKMELVLAEVDKPKRDLIDILRKKDLQIWVSHGIKNNKYEYIFARSGLLIPNQSMQVSGGELQTLVLTFSLRPTPANQTCQARVNGNLVTFSGLNRFYINIASTDPVGIADSGNIPDSAGLLP